MHVLALFCIICLMVLPAPSLAFAASPLRSAPSLASASDAGLGGSEDQSDDESESESAAKEETNSSVSTVTNFEKLTDDMSDMEFKDLFFEYLSSMLGGPGLASSSNAKASLESEADLLDSASPNKITAFDAPVLYSLENQTDFVNVERFDVTINGSSYTLLFSPSYADQLFVDAENHLWNMGTSTVQGRLIDGGFDPYAATGKLVYLSPCLGNNFSTINNYGSPNYVRTYYWSSGRLTYDDTYTLITVDRVYHTFKVSDTLNYVVIFVLLGGVLLIWLNRCKHY